MASRCSDDSWRVEPTHRCDFSSNTKTKTAFWISWGFFFHSPHNWSICSWPTIFKLKKKNGRQHSTVHLKQLFNTDRHLRPNTKTFRPGLPQCVKVLSFPKTQAELSHDVQVTNWRHVKPPPSCSSTLPSLMTVCQGLWWDMQTHIWLVGMLLNVTFAASIAGERIYKCMGRALIAGTWRKTLPAENKEMRDSFRFFIGRPAVCAVRGPTYMKRGRVAVTCDLFFLLSFVKSAMESAVAIQTVVDSPDDSLQCLGFSKVIILWENSKLCNR